MSHVSSTEMSVQESPSFTTNLEIARFEIDTETSGEHALLPRISTIQSY